MKIAVFASGRGSNFDAIMRAIRSGELRGVELALVLSDRPSAPVVSKAEAWGVRCLALEPKRFTNKAHYEAATLQHLQAEQVEIIVLAGYMRIIGETLLSAFANRIINIHPSLLPAFPGKDGIGDALRYGVKVTGVTIHFVDEGIDSGPIIAQQAVPVLEGDTRETLLERVQHVEHQLYPKVLQWFADGRVLREGRQVSVHQATRHID